MYRKTSISSPGAALTGIRSLRRVLRLEAHGSSRAYIGKLLGSVISLWYRTVIVHLVSLLAITITVFLAAGVINSLDFIGIFSLSLLLLAVVLLTVWDILEAYKERPRRYGGKSRETKVRGYMINLLAGDGKCVVSSNDLSWAQGDAKDALLKKATANSLELLMPRETELSKELEEAGAEVYYYGDAEYRFKSRFTIVNSARSDSYVAIGRGTRRAHLITLVDSNSDPVYHMATDLKSLAKRVAQKS